MTLFGGIEIIPNPILVKELVPAKQFRFPRSKKRRIRKKWRSKQENWHPRVLGPDPDLYMTRDPFTGREVLYGHPATVARLRELMRRELRS